MGENGTAASATATAEVKPLAITIEERLRLENFYLKAENLRLQNERLREDFAKSTKMLQDLQKETKAFTQGLNQKYGIDVTGFTIQPDGTLVPPMATVFGEIGPKGPPVRA